MAVSDTIRKLRTERGWSQGQMAKRLYVSRQAVTKWETGAGMPDVDNLAAIANLFGVSVDSLLFGEAGGRAGAGRNAELRAEPGAEPGVGPDAAPGLPVVGSDLLDAEPALCGDGSVWLCGLGLHAAGGVVAPEAGRAVEPEGVARAGIGEAGGRAGAGRNAELRAEPSAEPGVGPDAAPGVGPEGEPASTVGVALPLAGEPQTADAGQSLTLFDLDAPRHCDLSLGSARLVTVACVAEEKVAVVLKAPGIENLERAFKVKIAPKRKGLDICVASTGIVGGFEARESVEVHVRLPAAFVTRIELAVSAHELRLANLSCDVEVSGKIGRVRMEDIEGHIELDVPLDMEIWASGVRGRLDVNQIGAASVVHVGADVPFSAAARGMLGARRLRFTRDGEPCEAPVVDTPQLAIELAGARSELTIDAVSQP